MSQPENKPLQNSLSNKSRTLQAGPILREQDLFPEGTPYHPEWGIDWGAVDEDRDDEDWDDDNG